MQKEPWPKHSGYLRADIRHEPNLRLPARLPWGQLSTESRAGHYTGSWLNTHKLSVVVKAALTGLALLVVSQKKQA